MSTRNAELVNNATQHKATQHNGSQRNTTQRITTQHNATQLNRYITTATQPIATQRSATQQNSPQHNKTGNKNHAHNYAKQTSRGNVELDQKLHRKNGQKTLQVYSTNSPNYNFCIPAAAGIQKLYFGELVEFQLRNYAIITWRGGGGWETRGGGHIGKSQLEIGRVGCKI